MERSAARTAAFREHRVLENYPIERSSAQQQSSFAIRDVRIWSRTNYPLTLISGAHDAFLSLKLLYDRRRYDDTSISQILAHFRGLLESIIERPESRLSELALSTERDRQQLLSELPGMNRGRAEEGCVHELFEAQSVRRPDAIALVEDALQLSYRELSVRSNQLAGLLRGKGVRAGELVGVCMERSVDLVVALLGILKAGAAYVPVDPSYPEERVRFMLEDTGLRLLLSRRDVLSRAPANTEVIWLDGDREEIERQDGSARSSGVTSEDLAYVMYTSGLTGVPKGVEICHRGIVRLFFGSDYVHLDSAETVLHLSSISFDASTFELWGALVHGGRSVLYGERVPSPFELGAAVARYGVSVMWLTATFFNSVVRRLPPAAGRSPAPDWGRRAVSAARRQGTSASAGDADREWLWADGGYDLHVLLSHSQATPERDRLHSDWEADRQHRSVRHG